MIEPILNIAVEGRSLDELMSKEWLVTNGLGGYASGTVAGINTRRHHGLFVPNLASPRGRTMMMPIFSEAALVGADDMNLGGIEFSNGRMEAPQVELKEFRLDWQTPVWVYAIEGRLIEKKIFMPYGYNTVYICYRLISGEPLRLKLRPYCACRKHDSRLGYPQEWPFTVTFQGDHYELTPFEGAPAVRLTAKPFNAVFVAKPKTLKDIFYRIEYERGLDYLDHLYSCGYFTVDLSTDQPIYFIASTESWGTLEEDPMKVFDTECKRRKKLLNLADGAQDHLITAQLVLAADQFIVLPGSRHEKNALLDSSTERVRSVIAGYHWFTDWGRDTMISLEGLTLCTGRKDEAKSILLTFGRYVQNGLLPNHFPEGHRSAVYNTVDATFWYFHAIDRYLEWTQDTDLLEELFATLESIIAAHVKGTDFGIHLDQDDGLITAASEGFQLTWMDAKVDEWVVTPRRGKPVEIQALWYNALKLMESWAPLMRKSGEEYTNLAKKASDSFNQKFWYAEKNYCYDVIDAGKGPDPALRPNQIFTVSLHYPVLDQKHWKAVVDIVDQKLLTPYGLRTLDPAHKDYHGHYEGSLWERDAAYHQGLVWPWLIGPFWDAWKKVYHDHPRAKELFKAFEEHIKQSGIGTISEIFDGDKPHQPRGCMAQAWSVAELLRCCMDVSA
jgi:predicted glycogen debranching enzyme